MCRDIQKRTIRAAKLRIFFDLLAFCSIENVFFLLFCTKKRRFWNKKHMFSSDFCTNPHFCHLYLERGCKKGGQRGMKTPHAAMANAARGNSKRRTRKLAIPRAAFSLISGKDLNLSIPAYYIFYASRSIQASVSPRRTWEAFLAEMSTRRPPMPAGMGMNSPHVACT